MSRDTLRLSQEEMGRRFDELRAIKKGESEKFELVAQKWTKRKGKSVTAGMVRKYWSKVHILDKRGVNLHEAAKVYTWSYIIWTL